MTLVSQIYRFFQHFFIPERNKNARKPIATMPRFRRRRISFTTSYGKRITFVAKVRRRRRHD